MHISYIINRLEQIPELHILLHRLVCHLHSHHTVERREKCTSASCVITAQQAQKYENLRGLTFSNMASYFTYANQFVLIQRWAKSNASFLASSEGSLDKP